MRVYFLLCQLHNPISVSRLLDCLLLWMLHYLPGFAFTLYLMSILCTLGDVGYELFAEVMREETAS